MKSDIDGLSAEEILDKIETMGQEFEDGINQSHHEFKQRLSVSQKANDEYLKKVNQAISDFEQTGIVPKNSGV